MKIALIKTSLLILVIIATNVNSLLAVCIQGNCDNGFGISLIKGDKYIGEFENGFKDGQGVCFYASGSKYTGSWRDGHFDGEGRYTAIDGEVKAGVWHQGKFVKEQTTGCIAGNCDSGFGIFLYPSGTKYLGDFKNGQTVGVATTFYPDGSKFLGAFINGKKEGSGILYRADGSIDEGIWHADRLLGTSRRGYGCVDGNCREGYGKYVYPDNTIYEGEFKNGLAEGYGECYYPDGDRYKGEWKSHTFDGEGVLYISDGRIYKGNWKTGQLQKQFKTTQTTPKATKKAAPKVWAIVVGVARYRGYKTLRYTDDDAYRMYAFLKSPEGGALSDEQVTIMIDEDATKPLILSTIRDVFGQAKENDIVMFYFSGHGIKGAFLASDHENSNNKLLHSEIMAEVSRCKAKGKVIIADACHSGSISSQMVASRDDATVGSIIKNYYRAFEASSGGTALFLSSKANEVSIENYGLRQGIFSHYLIGGLKGNADEDGDRLITINELYKYVEEGVRSYTGNMQTPVIVGDYDNNMPLGIVR